MDPIQTKFGNFCIASHNYKNDTFFSNISLLVHGDIITIYDSFGTSYDYIVYDNYTTLSKDLEYINQNTNGQRIITLVTCDNLNNNYRTIIKAKSI